MFRRKTRTSPCQCECGRSSELANVVHRLITTNEHLADELRAVVRDQHQTIRLLADTVVMPENDQLGRAMSVNESAGEPGLPRVEIGRRPVRRVPPPPVDNGMSVEARVGGGYGPDPG